VRFDDPAFAAPFDLAAPSFSTLLRHQVPQALEGAFRAAEASMPTHVEGTTVLALTYAGDGQGVVMAGDRRATAGNVISKRDMRKVFEADAWSAVAVSGVAGPAMELAKVVVPLFAGYDPRGTTARIYEFDAAGGRYEEKRFASTGSGGRDARGSLKARYRADLARDEAVSMAIEALWDAADEDSATGGPDVVRGIYPLVAIIDADGYRELPDDDIAARVEQVITSRRI
jgi:proteasome beta subunit